MEWRSWKNPENWHRSCIPAKERLWKVQKIWKKATEFLQWTESEIWKSICICKSASASGYGKWRKARNVPGRYRCWWIQGQWSVRLSGAGDFEDSGWKINGVSGGWAFLGISTILEEILRTKEHSLSEEKEELLARVSELGRAPSNIYGMFNNADITFQPVKDENGNEQPLTQERYVHYLENKTERSERSVYKPV